MKKYLVNIILLFFIFLFAEICCLVYESRIIYNEISSFKDISQKQKIRDVIKYFIIPTYFDKRHIIYRDEIRNPAYTKSNKKPVLITGCSFAYGLFLDEKDCFHSILSKATGRTVYNIAVPSGSPRELLFLLKNYEKDDKAAIIPPVKQKIRYSLFLQILKLLFMYT